VTKGEFIKCATDKLIDQELVFTMLAFLVDSLWSLVDLFQNNKNLWTMFDTGYLPGLLIHHCSIKVGDGGLRLSL
jgi:hypothetical protein